MIPIQNLRENPEEYIERLAIRGIDSGDVIYKILEVDAQRREAQKSYDEKATEMNTAAKTIGKLMSEGNKEEAEKIKARVTELKEEQKSAQQDLQVKDDELRALLLDTPNAPQKDVPVGTSEKDNIEVKVEGELIEFSFDALPHWELAEKYKLIDFKSGAKITGSGFPVYTGMGAKLERALISYFLDFNTERGYTELMTPFVVNEASGIGTGQLPDKEGQMYEIPLENFYLIPTAEVPVTNMFRDEIVEELPQAYTAYSPCFRREAGSYGKDVKGLNRLHQFNKVEIVRIEKPENSNKAHQEMIAHVEALVQSLGMRYRILHLCGGDTGSASANTYDFEIYSAAQKRWLEVSSVSNFEAYQANRLQARYKDDNGKMQLVHTLNGSAMALPRVMACILENYQTSDGIATPSVLRPYLGTDYIA